MSGSAAWIAAPCCLALGCATAPAGVGAGAAGRPGLSTPAPEAGKAGIEWVTIPGGSFIMGSDDLGAIPQHAVHLKTFQIARTEVTAGQYKKCVEAGACTKPDRDSPGEDHPVVGVTWEQAGAFSEWVGGRLPSEAEWEYAARNAGKDWKYPWGNENATCERAVVDEGGLGCGKNSTWPVCSKPKGNTEQGLCDMAGNVWEWTQDWYHRSYRDAPTDGTAMEDFPGWGRVFRGGSWYCEPSMVQSALRDYGAPGFDSGDFLGFRPAR